MADNNDPYGIVAARAAGYDDRQIADYIAERMGATGIDEARKAGYSDAAIITHLLPSQPPKQIEQPAPAVPEPESGMLKGMAKAAGQEAMEFGGRFVSGRGAQLEALGTAIEGAPIARRTLDLMTKIDAGETIKPLPVAGLGYRADPAFAAAQKYLTADPDERAKLRQDTINTIAEAQLSQIGESTKKVGKQVSEAGKAVQESAERTFPLTEEEQGRFSVKLAKAATGLAGYIGTAAFTGLPGVVDLAGTESFGTTYNEAKQKGATDEDAAKAAFINSVVQGGLNVVPVHRAMTFMDKVPGAFRGQFMDTAIEMVKSSGTLLTFTQLATMAENAVAKNTYDPNRPLTQGVGELEGMAVTAAAGALVPVMGAGARRLAQAVTPTPKPSFKVKTPEGEFELTANPEATAEPVMAAPDVNTAIATARREVEQPEIEATAGMARELGTPADVEQADLLRLFGGLNQGTVERDQAGGFHYRTDEGADFPLRPWNGVGRADTIPSALATAQRDHYARQGVRIVYFENDARIPFDGAVDPNQPDTIFLSNNPSRNAAQVGAHEITHLFESTTLPDGTNLGDLLHQQVRAGITPEGQAYAERLFGQTAPQRGAFPVGLEGDSLHGDAVATHLIRELGADIGAEAPKFQTFLPRVIDAVEQRYGADTAKNVLARLIEGIRQAMTTLRKFFFKPEEMAELGQPPTVSQNWVTNLDQIHDTLAKMYAERFRPEGAEPYKAAVKAETDRLFETSSAEGGMGRRQPTLARNQNMADAWARFNVMHAEVGEPEIQRIVSDVGASPDHIDQISRFYKREEGQTPRQAFENAVSRWMDQAEKDAIHYFNLDSEDLAHDMLGAGGEHGTPLIKTRAPAGGRGEAPRAAEPGGGTGRGEAGRGGEPARQTEQQPAGAPAERAPGVAKEETTPAIVSSKPAEATPIEKEKAKLEAQRKPKPSPEVQAAVEEVKPGLQGMAQRQVNAENNMIETIMERGDLTKEQARKAFDALKSTKGRLKFDAVGGRYTVAHGRLLDRDVLRDLAGVEPIKEPAIEPKPEARPVAAETEVKAATSSRENADHRMADEVADVLDKRASQGMKVFAPNELEGMAKRHYGGTLAEGAYSRDRLYDAMELGVNRFIQKHPERFDPTVDAAQAKETAEDLARIKDKLPTQTVRAGEKETHQQFSTPPDYAYAVNWVANLRPTDHVLEPSAGVGGLLVHAMNAKVAETTGNELSEKRRGMLEALEPTRVTGEDAAQLDNILPADVKPTVVVMNPPFSRAAERMGGKMVLDEGAKHIEQALARLEPGGRLVAIVGDSMRPEGQPGAAGYRGGQSGTGRAFRDWWNKIGGLYDVRANVGVDGDIYGKYGTTFPTRLLVIDKTEPSGRELVTGQVKTAAELINRLQEVRDDRSTIEPVAREPGRPEVAPRGEGPAGPERELPGPTGVVGTGEGRRGAAGAAVTEPAGAAQPGASGRNAARNGRGQGEPVPPVQPEPAGRGANEQPGAATAAGAGTEGRRPTGGGDGIRPDGSGERDQPGVTEAPADVVATEEAVSAPDTKAPLSEAIYEPYKPQRVQFTGAKAHPGALVQSAAMASVLPPKTDYKPKLPASLVKDGALSDAQLEAVTYAGHAHSDVMPGGRRRGFFIGDGTGVGKGREIAGIILDNKQNGRTKSVWVSEKRALINDAKRDWNGLGQPATDIIDHGKFKAGDDIKGSKGILFTTYDTLKSAEQRKTETAEGGVEKVRGKERVQQIIDWLGKDFDGVIIFDEAHNMGNAVDEKGARGVKKASQKALAGMKLQNELPNARVVYVSATGATEVQNLAYADRLGLWGEGTSFAGRQDFVGKISEGGVAAMELVARDMKALGHYIARNLSYDGVDYDRVEHKLSPDQRGTYDKLAEGWQVVLQNFHKAMADTGITNKNGSTRNGKARAAIMSAFWGGHQRFFNQVITSMQMPAVIRGVEADIKAKRQAVLQLVNTMEAAQERALEKARASGAGEIEDLDMTPRDQLMQLVEKSYPVEQYEEYKDDNGNIRSRPVKDSKGNPVLNRQAVEARDRLLDELGSLRVPDGPLEILLNHFGPDQVAEVTGRGQRVVKKPDETGRLTTQVEKRGAQSSVADANDFQSGKKKILVFSEAGGTGRSYHAAIGSGSEDARRSHYLVQGGWRADKAVQGFGRTHRTNQASAPIFHLVTTDLDGQKRFISSIARRLGQLGALTKGERRTGDQGMFGMRDNLESTEARDALRQFFGDVERGDVEGVDTATLEKQMGLKLRDANGKPTYPEMSQFLNRVLSLNIDHQNRVFRAFSDRLDQVIERAAAAGTLDTGVETYKADKLTKLSEQTVFTDPRSGAETKHVHLNAETRNHPVSFDATLAGRNKTNGQRPLMFVQNLRSEKVFAVSEAGNRTDANGNVFEQRRLTSPTDYQMIDRDKVGDRERWKKLTVDEARPLWDKQVAETPEFRKSDLHLITGAVLPIWDRIGGNPKIFRLQTDQGEKMLGRVIPAERVNDVLERLGAEKTKITETPGEVAQRVLQGATARLANEWAIKSSRVAGERRLELVGPDYRYNEELSRHGIFSERIQYNTRYFIPTEPKAAAAAIEAITKTRPVTSLAGERGAAFSPRVGEEPRPAFYSGLTRAVEGVKQEKATPGQWEGMLRNLPGVKPEERAWVGLDDWLRKQPKSVTKAEVLDYLRANEIQVTERQLGGLETHADLVVGRNARGEWHVMEDGSDAPIGGTYRTEDEAQRALDRLSRDATKYGGYRLPGGKNYRELLLTLPIKERLVPRNGLRDWIESRHDSQGRWFRVSARGEWDTVPFASKAEADAALPKPVMVPDRSRDDRFQSSHWDEPNILAHIRFDDRTGPNGEKVLHVAEIQSDWHQKGRKEGYRQELTPEEEREWAALRPTGGKNLTSEQNERWHYLINKDYAAKHGVPDAPFKTTWPELAMKRVIRYAAENGYDRVSWDTGATNADRYDLSKQIRRVDYYPTLKKMQAFPHEGRLIEKDNVEPGDLADLIGKDAAERLLASPIVPKGHTFHRLEGEGLHIGGEGMKAFYDKQLPIIANKIGKRFGTKVEDSSLVASKEWRYSIVNPRGITARGGSTPEAAERAAAEKTTEGPWTVQDNATATHSLPITDAMREGVMQGQPLFSPRVSPDYTPEQREAVERVFGQAPTAAERIAEAKQDAGRKILRGTVDPYIGLKGDDPEGYMAARLANSSAGAVRYFMEHGPLHFEGPALDADASRQNGGVKALRDALGKEDARFMQWVVGNRSDLLAAQDREHLLRGTDIEALKELNRGQLDEPYTLSNGKTTLSREAAYMDSLRKLDALNRNAMELNVEAGNVKRGVADALLENPYYVPYYRMAEDAGTRGLAGPGLSSGMVKQYAFKSLKGGTEKLADPWVNATRNWEHMIDAAMRNRTAVRVLDKAEEMGAAEKITPKQYELLSKAEKKNASWVMIDGQKQYYQVHDPMVMSAISALDYMPSRGIFMRIGRGFSGMLRYGVTASPLFAARNLMRDSTNAIAVSGISKNPVKNLWDGFNRQDMGNRLQNIGRAVAGQEIKTRTLSQEEASALAGGGLMRLGAFSGEGVDLTTLDTPSKLGALGRYISRVAGASKEAVGISEDVNRQALYTQLREQGASHAFAAFSARDLQDFTLKGAWPWVRTITEITPFLNARMQGLYKLGRAASDADKNVALAVSGRVARNMAIRLATVYGAMTIAGLALDAFYQDDEDYKKRTEYDRQTYYWFKIGNSQFQIPKGFELAALSSLTTDGIEAFFSKEMTGQRLAKNIWLALGAQLQMQAPAFVQPILDVAANTRGTGGPIETAGMERLEPQQRYTINSTLAGRGVTSAWDSLMRTIQAPDQLKISPVQFDYLVNAYGGWLATHVLGMADNAARSFTSEPTRPDQDFWTKATGGMIRTDTAPQSRYVDMLYEQGKQIEEAHATFLNLAKLGRREEARDFAQSRQDELRKYPAFERVKRLEGEINQRIRVIENSAELSGEQKRLRIMQLQAQKNRAAQGLFANGP